MKISFKKKCLPALASSQKKTSDVCVCPEFYCSCIITWPPCVVLHQSLRCFLFPPRIGWPHYRISQGVFRARHLSDSFSASDFGPIALPLLKKVQVGNESSDAFPFLAPPLLWFVPNFSSIASMAETNQSVSQVSSLASAQLYEKKVC